MPLSTVCVSTVSSRPRAWASYSNIRAKDVSELPSMNSAEEISKYRQTNETYYSPTLNRKLLGYGYDFPEKTPKKEKKWSIGSLFRRKKKEESESSSEEDFQKKSFLNRKKRKSDKRKKNNKPVGKFDHVVLSRNSYLYSNGYNNCDEAILSDPSTRYAQNHKLSRDLPQETTRKPFINEFHNSHASLGTSSADSLNKKPRKGLAKVRAEARRLTLKHDSSSDEDSQRSLSSSRFRSDESIGLHREGSFNRRSRAARTERYLRRQSKDGENPSNYLRLSKSDVENSALNWRTSDDSNRSLSRSPLVPKAKSINYNPTFSSLSLQSPSILGLSTIPPSHGSYNKIKVSNSTSNPSYKPPLSMNDYNLSTKKLSSECLHNQRSVSCDANIHKAPSSETVPAVIHVQFPLVKPSNHRHSNSSLVDTRFMGAVRQPPPPPPRDPKRVVATQYVENQPRPNTYYFDSTGQIRSKSVNSQAKRTSSYNLNFNNRSTSEDNLPKNNVYLLPRPSSTTPEANNKILNKSREANAENYNYLTDKKPRSRKPIFIKSNAVENREKTEAQKALDFWMQKDIATKDQRAQSKSPRMFTCQTHVQTQVFLPSVLQNDITGKLSNTNNDFTQCKNIATENSRESCLPCNNNLENDSKENDEDMKRKSSNLEEALDELEAIYNSLRLGDEDLLERAEQREKDAAAKSANGNLMYVGWAMPKGALSDSGFSYEPFDLVNGSRRKRLVRKSQTIDRKGDDMAFRKLHKERSQTINDPQSVISNISYLQSTPAFGADIVDDLDTGSRRRHKSNRKSKEPNITLDDVLYRNIKYANTSPKVVEPQPPFGIPLGPITVAANSDYLHAVPDNIHRPTFKPRKIPDLVKDDLAFRNLRKDHKKDKEPVLPPLSVDDVKNNNMDEPKIDLNSLKKKRAVRSLSANIGSLINKDVLAKGLGRYQNNNIERENEFKTLTDIADAMDIARKVLREKESKISATKRAFLSDTDTTNGNCDVLESRMNFLNSLKQGSSGNTDGSYLHLKPPRGLTPDRKSPRSPKESTPIPVSPLSEGTTGKIDSNDSSLDDLLSALATEARETSERITNELNYYKDDEKNADKGSSTDLNKTLCEIDAVSQQAKLCKKFLVSVVDSNNLMNSDTKPTMEEVKEMNDERVMHESKANIVLSRGEDHRCRTNKKNDKTCCESDHDYENLVSDNELTFEEINSDKEKKCISPFEEHKAELIASFQELKKNVNLLDLDVKTANDKVKEENDKIKSDTGKHSPRRSRSRLPRWLRPHYCEDISETELVMSEESRTERINKYKEQRRKQLAAQFATHSDSVSRKQLGKDSNSSSSEGPRGTRTSRLRAAATADVNASPPNSRRNDYPEKSYSTPPSSSPYETAQTPKKQVERDKSNKRKSNLNRALNSEEVIDSDDANSRRRRRRFLPEEILEQTVTERTNAEIKYETNKSDSHFTASGSPISPITASSAKSKITPKKSELRIHMENARKGVTPSYSEMGGKYKPFVRRASTASPKEKLKNSDVDSSHSDKELTYVNKENQRKYFLTSNKNKSNSDNEIVNTNRSIAKKMDEITALTRETLARVEKLSTKTAKEPVQSVKKSLRHSPIKQTESVNNKLSSVRSQQPYSILKKKSLEEPVIVESVPNAVPVSILKRKVSQDEKSETHTPPVTFSPNVVEPATTNRKQGILKKRRSLDESQVMRHRSCSPDVASKLNDSRSILKGQRRSSLEELTRTQSPELHLQGILKRKTSRAEEDDGSLSSPQSILKRRSGASSAGSSGGTPHVSITTAVILAAAGGAEMVLNENETVKPILKKKSFSEEYSFSESCHSEVPKPILKKKSSTDTEEYDEKPKRPILKISRNSSERDNVSEHSFDTNRHFPNFKMNIPNNDTDCDVKPILKQNGSKEDAPRHRLSFCSERTSDEVTVTSRNTRRSNTICVDFNSVSLTNNSKEEDRNLRKRRPISVSELVMSFETTVSTGAIPKRSNLKRSSDRYRTQPITSNELEASLNYVRSPQIPKSSPLLSPEDNHGVNSLLDFTSSLENDNNLNSFLSSFHNTSSDIGVSGKMSSDSAFQSLGDGLELDDDKSLEASTKPTKLEPIKLELQMKAIAEEAKSLKLGLKGNATGRRFNNRKLTSDISASSRFSTQPVTFDEVQEASRINKDSDDSEDKGEADPSNLSLSERIKLFSAKVNESALQKREVPKRRINRFQTQPVTSTEVETARCISPTTYALEGKEHKKGILKASTSMRTRLDSPPSLPKPVLKKRDSLELSSDHETNNRFPVLKNDDIPDITYDEGISCNDSGSDSELPKSPEVKFKIDEQRSRTALKFGKSGSDTTSDGDSSGGREVRSIFRNENKLKVKQALENVLSKSRSQNEFGDETDVSSTRKTNIRRSQTHAAMPRTIAEIQAKLQESGESGWKKRFQQNSVDELKLLKDKNRYNDELSEKSILASKKDELDAASQQWKCRVEKSDAEKFSVAGRMEKQDVSSLSVNIPTGDKHKRTPQAKRFKGKEGSDSSSTPVSPDNGRHAELSRSYSVPEREHESSGSDSNLKAAGRKVSLIKPDDFTFKNFYKSIEETKHKEQFDVNVSDFDLVPRQSLLVQKKNVQVRSRRGASKNPIKALAMRTDIQTEYTEIITGVAEREKKRLNIEKLAKHSNLAVEALAGLASKEDFTSVALKKSPTQLSMVPFKDIMLLQVKGRRHVQTRLVEPVAQSINEGDNFILVTGSACFNYVGPYSNVIEQSHAADIMNHIQQTGDLGCKNAKIITLDGKNLVNTKDCEKFFKILGCDASSSFTGAGHPDEDEIYENNIIATNMIYGLDANELVPLDEYWGTIPKVEMLQPNKVYVFDFGSEMYVWSGKNAPIDKKRLILKLAKELWDEGFNYSQCAVNPLNISTLLGNRKSDSVSLKGSKRPDWALFAKLTQHRETILFKEKFLDWPDFSRVIRVKGDDLEKSIDPSYHITSCNVDEMLKPNTSTPDLIVENHHLGRGNSYFDDETKRLFEFDTLSVSVWRILENSSEKLSQESIGHFYDGDSYIIRWDYRMTVKGRELSGKPSKFAQAGRERSVFFCWQGSNASINEKGLAALLTVELDSDKAPQVRVSQGAEHPAFLRLFRGAMIVHKGKRDEPDNIRKPRLFMIKGELEEEVSLIEVSCDAASLRSRTSFVLIDADSGKLIIWHGAKSSKQNIEMANILASRLIENKPKELFLENAGALTKSECDEGVENSAFLNLIDINKRDKYMSLLDDERDFDYTMRLFYLSSISGTFKAVELLCPYRSEFSSPYPFQQNDLYSASQPALFLIDNHYELYLWQGWWPELEEENVELQDQTGSGAVRWQAERKAAMQTAVDYWLKNHSGDQSVPAYLVWAGLEPLDFKNLFPCWTDREDIAELNLKEGRKRHAKLLLEEQLALLKRTTYPLAELLQRPLPEGVDPTHLELYLSPNDFQELLSMTKEEFQKLPLWKQTAVKKEKGLF